MFACEEIKQAANDNKISCVICDSTSDAPFAKKFCGRRCYDKAYAGSRVRDRSKDKERDRHKNGTEFECVGCGINFKRRTNSRNKGRYCSRKCAFSNAKIASAENREWAARQLVTFSVARCICEDCGIKFTAGAVSAEVCDTCRTYRRDARRGVDRSSRACMQCGIEFIPPYGRAHASYCSNDCCSLRNYILRRNLHTDPANENVDPFVVFDRDGWRCQMCFVKTPRRLRGTHHPRAPELDHIIPVSKGGSHTYINTQCACSRCNRTKNNKIIGQLRLFG